MALLFATTQSTFLIIRHRIACFEARTLRAAPLAPGEAAAPALRADELVELVRGIARLDGSPRAGHQGADRRGRLPAAKRSLEPSNGGR